MKITPVIGNKLKFSIMHSLSQLIFPLDTMNQTIENR